MMLFFIFLVNVLSFSFSFRIMTDGSESRDQGGSHKRHSDGLKTHMCEYFTGTRVMKSKMS